MAISIGFSSSIIDDVLTKIPETAILAYYFNITELPNLIQAPYRPDKNPSLGLYLTDKGKVMFKDFATGDNGGIIDLLMKVWNSDFKHTISRIEKDCPVLTTFTKKLSKNSPNNLCHKSDSDINVKFREWKPYDIDYWETYGVSLEWLKFGDVYPISRIFYTSNGKTVDYPADKYAYAYIERKEGNITMKIYQPLSNIRKWINKHDSSVWDLWSKLPPYGDKLIITSSRKDALCIWENTGIPSVSLQGEGYIPKEHVVQELKNRFKDVYVLYDNDFKSDVNHGRKFGRELAEKFNLIQIEIPDSYKSKDTSDLCKNHGRETVNNVITKLVNVVTYIDDLPF